MSFQFEFKSFLGAIEHQLVPEDEAAVFLQRQTNLGAQLIAVTAPDGQRWTGADAHQQVAQRSAD